MRRAASAQSEAARSCAFKSSLRPASRPASRSASASLPASSARTAAASSSAIRVPISAASRRSPDYSASTMARSRLPASNAALASKIASSASATCALKSVVMVLNMTQQSSLPTNWALPCREGSRAKLNGEQKCRLRIELPIRVLRQPRTEHRTFTNTANYKRCSIADCGARQRKRAQGDGRVNADPRPANPAPQASVPH